MIDSDAVLGRRAWVECARCDHGAACAACRAGHTCGDHWRYLLAADGRRIFVQCPACRYRWWHDTGFGAGSRPERPPLDWPGVAA